MADAVPRAGETLWGVLYEIPPEELAALDAKEGYREGRPRARNAYLRLTGTVRLEDGPDGRALPAYLYVVANPRRGVPPPSPKYLTLLLRGARHWRLPPEYIEKLERVPTLE